MVMMSDDRVERWRKNRESGRKVRVIHCDSKNEGN